MLAAFQLLDGLLEVVLIAGSLWLCCKAGLGLWGALGPLTSLSWDFSSSALPSGVWASSPHIRVTAESQGSTHTFLWIPPLRPALQAVSWAVKGDLELCARQGKVSAACSCPNSPCSFLLQTFAFDISPVFLLSPFLLVKFLLILNLFFFFLFLF